MGLFDQEEDRAAGDAAFDDESKIRLFETQQRESAEGYNYVKKFLPVAVVAVVIVGAVIYMMQPGVGDVVKPPKAIEDSVYDYMLAKEKRSVREINFYECGGWYWVKVLAEPRSSLASVDDPANQYRLRVDAAGERASNITTLPLPDKANDVPCKSN